MVEPVSLTLGALVAALVVKAAEKTGEEVAEGSASVAGRLLGWLRTRLTHASDTQASTALERVADAPDSPSRVEQLGRILDERTTHDPTLRIELERWVQLARDAGVTVNATTQTATGNQNTQVNDVLGSTITITHDTNQPNP